jgi:hypothetical protein
MAASFYFFLGAILLPPLAFRRLLADARALGRGFRVVLLIGLLYAATSFARAATGAVPMAPTWVKFAEYNYLIWQTLFILPIILLIWILTAGLLQLLGRRGPRAASFEATAGLAGYAVGLPLLLLWVPQAVGAGLMLMGMSQAEWVEILSRPGSWQTFFLGVHVAAAAWALVLLTLAARLAHKLPWWRALLTGLVVTTVAAAVFLGLVR